MSILDLILQRSKVSVGYKAVNKLIKRKLQDIIGYTIDRGVESTAVESC